MNEFLGQVFWLIGFLLDIAMFITFPIYILLLITLWKYRKEETLKHSFFKLMFSIGIADIGVISTIFFARVAEWGWFPLFFIGLGGFSSRIFNFFNLFFAMAQALGVFVVAINRYTAYMMPLRHQKVLVLG
jgi:MFS family permease